MEPNIYPYPFKDEKGKIICQICGKSFLLISPTHLKKHNIKFDDYKKRFPDAPVANEEFADRGKFGKVKNLFSESEDVEPIIEDNEPEIEELKIETFIQNSTPVNPMEAMKMRILDQLKLYFNNVRKDYLIRQFGVDQRLKFEFITDFCDPILKIVIQFPDTFWHNKEALIDINKNYKLSKYGWKIIEIPGKSPDYDTINSHLDN